MIVGAGVGYGHDRSRVGDDGSLSRDALLINLGGEWRLSDRLMLSFGYRSNPGTAGSSHGVEAAIRIGW